MAKKAITNVSMALACARKLRSGKACTMKELKAALMLLEQGYKTVQRNKKAVEKNLSFMERQMDRISNMRTN